MTGLLILLGWFLCGLTAVFVLGLSERFGGHRFDNEASMGMFVMGPIGLAMILIVEGFSLIGRLLKPVFYYVKALGRGEL